MVKFVIVFDGEPVSSVKALYYEVEDGFMHFYDDEDNLIVSYNVNAIDYVVDYDNLDKVGVFTKEDECDCDDCECGMCDCDDEEEVIYDNSEDEDYGVKVYEDDDKYVIEYKGEEVPTKTEKDDLDEILKKIFLSHGKD